MKIPMFYVLLLLPVAAWSAPQQLHSKIAKAIAKSADLFLPPTFCGNVARLRYDPKKLPDGSPSYFDNSTGNLIVQCPNPMIRPTVPPAPRVCPPAEWKCGGGW
ncbi:MAG: hypothetical protein ABI268_05615 [Rhodanobacter sp.]